jgi:hypothetical protein
VEDECPGLNGLLMGDKKTRWCDRGYVCRRHGIRGLSEGFDDGFDRWGDVFFGEWNNRETLRTLESKL